MTITFEGPAIMVEDIKKSRIFYEEILGQEVLADFGPNVPFKSGFSIWQAGHATEVIFSGKHGCPTKLAHDNFELYFESAELDEAWAKVEKSCKDIIHPIVEAPWGQRGFRLRDPDGHIVEIGEPLPILIKRLLDDGLTPEAVTVRTSVPLEFVTAIVNNSD